MDKDNNRRSSDSALISMAGDVGEMKGMVKEMTRSFDEFKKRHEVANEARDNRILSLENTRTWGKGIVSAVGVMGGAIGAFIHWLIEGKHG